MLVTDSEVIQLLNFISILVYVLIVFLISAQFLKVSSPRFSSFWLWMLSTTVSFCQTCFFRKWLQMIDWKDFALCRTIHLTEQEKQFWWWLAEFLPVTRSFHQHLLQLNINFSYIISQVFMLLIFADGAVLGWNHVKL